jgi:ABC-type Fe3+/spermidine/putrescine transport system ATPase subunit
MVAVMHAGELLQFGLCSEVFARPNGVLAGKLLGVENIWQGKISNLTTTGLLRVRIGSTLDTVLDVSSSLGPDCAPPVGSPVHVYARATNVNIMPPQACTPEREGNFLRGRLLQRRQLPTFVQLRCEIGPGAEVLAYAPGWQWREWLPAPGDELCIHVHPADLHFTML